MGSIICSSADFEPSEPSASPGLPGLNFRTREKLRMLFRFNCISGNLPTKPTSRLIWIDCTLNPSALSLDGKPSGLTRDIYSKGRVARTECMIEIYEAKLRPIWVGYPRCSHHKNNRHYRSFIRSLRNFIRY